MSHAHTVILMRERKGFVKLALKTGVPIVVRMDVCDCVTGDIAQNRPPLTKPSSLSISTPNQQYRACPPRPTRQPCYIFGNTKLMSCFYDSQGILQWASRKLQAGILPIWGRWGLPIFHRQPILGVCGKPIVVPKVAEPTQELIDKYHAQFVDDLEQLFDRYRALYGNGFEHKRLLIK